MAGASEVEEVEGFWGGCAAAVAGCDGADDGGMPVAEAADEAVPLVCADCELGGERLLLLGDEFWETTLWLLDDLRVEPTNFLNMDEDMEKA